MDSLLPNDPTDEEPVGKERSAHAAPKEKKQPKAKGAKAKKAAAAAQAKPEKDAGGAAAGEPGPPAKSAGGALGSFNVASSFALAAAGVANVKNAAANTADLRATASVSAGPLAGQASKLAGLSLGLSLTADQSGENMIDGSDGEEDEMHQVVQTEMKRIAQSTQKRVRLTSPPPEDNHLALIAMLKGADYLFAMLSSGTTQKPAWFITMGFRACVTCIDHERGFPSDFSEQVTEIKNTNGRTFITTMLEMGLLEQVFSLMANFPMSVKVQKEGICVANSLMATDSLWRNEALHHGIVETMMRSMASDRLRDSAHFPHLVREICLAFALLAAEDTIEMLFQRWCSPNAKPDPNATAQEAAKIEDPTLNEEDGSDSSSNDSTPKIRIPKLRLPGEKSDIPDMFRLFRARAPMGDKMLDPCPFEYNGLLSQKFGTQQILSYCVCEVLKNVSYYNHLPVVFIYAARALNNLTANAQLQGHWLYTKEVLPTIMTFMKRYLKVTRGKMRWLLPEWAEEEVIVAFRNYLSKNYIRAAARRAGLDKMLARLETHVIPVSVANLGYMNLPILQHQVMEIGEIISLTRAQLLSMEKYLLPLGDLRIMDGIASTRGTYGDMKRVIDHKYRVLFT